MITLKLTNKQAREFLLSLESNELVKWTALHEHIMMQIIRQAGQSRPKNQRPWVSKETDR